MDNNAFVYCSEEDCAEVDVQFGIFSARWHLRQSGSFSFDKDKWRSEFPDGLFSKRISRRFIWYLFHRACRRHLALCKPTQDAHFWLYFVSNSYYDNANSFYDNQADLRVKAMTVLLIRLIINVKRKHTWGNVNRISIGFFFFFLSLHARLI